MISIISRGRERNVNDNNRGQMMRISFFLSIVMSKWRYRTMVSLDYCYSLERWIGTGREEFSDKHWRKLITHRCTDRWSSRDKNDVVIGILKLIEEVSILSMIDGIVFNSHQENQLTFSSRKVWLGMMNLPYYCQFSRMTSTILTLKDCFLSKGIQIVNVFTLVKEENRMDFSRN